MNDLQQEFKHIAIVGQPGHGKSTVQKILTDAFAYVAVDDGRQIRDMGKMMFGLTEHQVTTQEGKLETVLMPDGRWMKVRDVLGQIGEIFEERFGEYAVPAAAVRCAEALDMPSICPGFTYGSVRRTQPNYYKAIGGYVIEVTDPRKHPSPYDFDQYDQSAVNVCIVNDGSLADLHWKVKMLMINNFHKRSVA